MPRKISEEKIFTVIASSSIDTLIYKKSNITKTKKGGPLFYIKKVLKGKRIPFDTISFDSIKVEILINSKGEFGKIKKRPKEEKISYVNINSPNLIISTILNEISLSGLEKYSGKIFIDLQGFVRNGKHYGEKKEWLAKKEIFDSFFCVKGTEEEVKYIPKKFLKDQKK